MHFIVFAGRQEGKRTRLTSLRYQYSVHSRRNEEQRRWGPDRKQSLRAWSASLLATPASRKQPVQPDKGLPLRLTCQQLSEGLPRQTGPALPSGHSLCLPCLFNTFILSLRLATASPRFPLGSGPLAARAHPRTLPPPDRAAEDQGPCEPGGPLSLASSLPPGSHHLDLAACSVKGTNRKIPRNTGGRSHVCSRRLASCPLSGSSSQGHTPSSLLLVSDALPRSISARSYCLIGTKGPGARALRVCLQRAWLCVRVLCDGCCVTCVHRLCVSKCA